MVLTITLIVILVSLITYLYVRWCRIRDYWKAKGVPHSPPHPIFGSLTFLQRQNPIDWLKNGYQEFAPAPYFGIWLFWKPGLVICSPELAKNILVKDQENFRDRYSSAGKSDPIGALNLFNVKDPLWTDLRRRLTFLFTASKLKTAFPLKLQKAKELVQRIKNETEKKTRIDIRDLYTNFTTDIISASAFGIAGEATLTGDSPMRVVTKEFMKYDLLRGIAWSSIFFLPSIVDFFKFTFFPKVTTDYFRKAFAIIIEQRGGWQKKTVEIKDLIDSLVKMRQESKAEGKELSEDILVAQAAIFLQGGFDTTAVAMSFGSYELAYNSEIQERLYKELREAKDKLEGDFEYQSLVDLPYLNAFIKETLRKYPAMGWMDRVAAYDYKVDDKLTITKGTPVYVNAGGIQNDSQYFPDPTKFNPDRFLPENEVNIKPYTYMPFGEGPRICIGLRFAYQTLRVGFAHLVLNFKLTPVPGEATPQEIKPDCRGIFIAPDRVLTLRYVPRM